MIAFYAVAKMKEGGHAFEVMWRGEVDTIRDSSQNAYRKDDKGEMVPNKMSPWWGHYESMGRKTVLEGEYAPSFGDEDDADIESVCVSRIGRQAPAVAAISKLKINQRKESASDSTLPPSKPDLVNAILQSLTDSITEEEILEAEDLIRELKNPNDRTKCEQVLAHKREVMGKARA